MIILMRRSTATCKTTKLLVEKTEYSTSFYALPKSLMVEIEVYLKEVKEEKELRGGSPRRLSLPVPDADASFDLAGD